MYCVWKIWACGVPVGWGGLTMVVEICRDVSKIWAFLGGGLIDWSWYVHFAKCGNSSYIDWRMEIASIRKFGGLGPTHLSAGWLWRLETFPGLDVFSCWIWWLCIIVHGKAEYLIISMLAQYELTLRIPSTIFRYPDHKEINEQSEIW